MNKIAEVQQEYFAALEATRRERDDYKRYVAANLCDFSIHLHNEGDFHIKAESCSAEGFTTARFKTRAGKAQLDRRASEIRADGQDRYAIYLPIAGDLEVLQFGREERCTPGSFTLLTAAEPLTWRKLGDNDTIYFFMPREFVDQRIVRGEEACGRPVAARDGIRHLVHETLLAMHNDSSSIEPEDFQRASQLIGELVLLAIRDMGDVTSNLSAIRAGNLARAKRIIRKRCSNPDLTLPDIAKECGLSLRYLHDLFRGDGRTVYEYLTIERLRRARRLLESASPATTTVTSVSLASGYQNLSQFSAAFRRAFSISPRDVLHRSGEFKKLQLSR